MIALWTTQCPKCGPLLVRAAQPVKGQAFSFGETWCALCGTPATEIFQRQAEEGDQKPEDITGLLSPLVRKKGKETAP